MYITYNMSYNVTLYYIIVCYVILYGIVLKRKKEK